MKIRIYKSITFLVGLGLVIAALAVLLVAGSIFNPPPYRIVIAVQDIPPHSVISREMLAVDSQTMHQKVASRLVHESGIDQYVGGLVIETIHAGEPLRRNAVVAADNPAVVHRLSLALTDPDLVAVVVPVDAKVIPDRVTAGDFVNIAVGLQGSVSQQVTSFAGLPAPMPTPAAVVSPTTGVGSGVASEESELPSLEEQTLEEEEILPPLDKVVLQQIEVIGVGREKVPNPNYGMSLGGENGSQDPPFLEGDIESITVLVPQAAEELLYFGVDNGTLHVSVVPHTAVVQGPAPSTGVVWKDFVRFFEEERLKSLGLITETVAAEVEPEVSAPISPTTSLPASEPVTATEVMTETAVTPTPGASGSLAPATSGDAPSGSGGEASAASAPVGESGAPGTVSVPVGELQGYIVPACAGVGIVGVLLVGGLLVARRRAKE